MYTLLLFALACSGPGGPGGSGDSGAADGGAAGGGSQADLHLDLVQAESMPTVFTARWTGEGDSAWASIGVVGELAREVQATATADGWEAVLWGVPEDSDVEVTVGVVGSGGEQTQSTQANTGQIPVDVVRASKEVVQADKLDDGLLFLSQGELLWDIQVLDGDGRLVWAYEDPGENVAVMRVAPSRDGRAILYNRFPLLLATGDFSTNAWIVRVPLDGGPPEEMLVPWGHHDFYEHPDGTLAVLTFDEREVDGQTIRGDSIIEIAPDGSQREIWNSWDSFPFVESEVSFMGDADYWPYANTLEFDEDNGTYTIGLKVADCIFNLDRDSLEVNWQVGGPDSEYSFQGEGALMKEQHGHQVVGDELLVFDNREPSDGSSRGVSFQLDHGSKTVTQNWERYTDPPRFSLVGGDMLRAPNGNTMVVWSLLGMIEELDPEGELVATLRYDQGAMAYVTRTDGLPDQGP